MSCHERQTQLQEFLGGELAPELCQELKAHLGQCASCRRDLEYYRMLMAKIPDLPEPPVPADLTDAVMTSIRPQWAVLRRQRETTTATWVRRSLLLFFAFGFVGTLGAALWGWIVRLAGVSAHSLARDVATVWEATKELWSLITLLGEVATVLQPTASSLWTTLERLGAPLVGFGPLIVAAYAAALGLGALLCWRAFHQAGERGLHHAA